MTITTRVVRAARKRNLKVYTRNQWGCPNLAIYAYRRKFRRHSILPGEPVDTLWCHITVTRRNDIKSDMRELHSIGMDRFGSGVSYNFGIDMVTGEIGLGQSLDAAGTHTLNDKNIPGYSYNQNYVSLAIAFIGVPGNKPSEVAVDAAAKLIASLIDCGALTRGHDFNPHRLVAAKDCPTDPVVAVMPVTHKQAMKLTRGH